MWTLCVIYLSYRQGTIVREMWNAGDKKTAIAFLILGGAFLQVLIFI